MTREYTCPPGDSTPCPECDAPGGPAGAIRVRGIMIEQQYNDRRCNSCGHRWTVGDTMELSLGETEPPDPGLEAPPEPPVPGGVDVEPYDFGDGWEPDVEGIPF